MSRPYGKETVFRVVRLKRRLALAIQNLGVTGSIGGPGDYDARLRWRDQVRPVQDHRPRVVYDVRLGRLSHARRLTVPGRARVLAGQRQAELQQNRRDYRVSSQFSDHLFASPTCARRASELEPALKRHLPGAGTFV